MKSSTLYRIFLLWTMGWMLLLLTGCTTAWTTEAQNIIALLGPSISSILAILAAFGVGISPAALTAIQSWSAQATTGLQTVATLITEYNTAEASAQPGLLTEIQTALSAIVSNLAAILPEIHITDASTQAKVMAIIDAVQMEMQALINLVPALQGKTTSHDELKVLIANVGTAKEFKAEFNRRAGVFGKQYELK